MNRPTIGPAADARHHAAWSGVVFVVFATSAYREAHGGGPALLYIGLVLSARCLLVVLASKVTSPSASGALLADRAGQSESPLLHDRAALGRRELPIHRCFSIQPARGHPVKHTIVLSEN
jgi:hypothetical protein